MKKGYFLPFLSFLTFLVFLSIAAAMLVHNENLKQQGKVGLQAASLYKMYDEGEKINFYLQLAAEYSSKELLLGPEGGYSRDNNCQKTSNGYNLWNSCPDLNPEDSFKEEFKNRFQKYLNSYKSTYETFPVTVFDESEQVLVYGTEDMRSLINDEVNQDLIESFKIEDNLFFINLKPIELKPEQTIETSYTINPQLKIFMPDFEIYDKFYLALSNCNSVDSCSQKVNEIAENINILAQGSIIQIDYTDIHFAFDTSRPIQGKYNPLTTA